MKINYDKNSRLAPAIIQDANTNKVLMLAYMNEEAYQQTLKTKKVTFYSRSRNKIWVKGEESKNYLNLVEIKLDCDQDTLLIKAVPEGPICHTGEDTCWNETNHSNFGFLTQLEKVITERKENPSEKSYVSSLFSKGLNKIAQKVGEEAVELIIESKDNDENLFLNEGADLLFHYLILLQAKGYKLKDIVGILEQRHK